MFGIGAFHCASKDSGNLGRNSNGKGPLRFLLTGILEITSGGGPLISTDICRSVFDKPVLCPGGGTLEILGGDVPLGPSNPYPMPELIQLNHLFATLY